MVSIHTARYSVAVVNPKDYEHQIFQQKPSKRATVES